MKNSDLIKKIEAEIKNFSEDFQIFGLRFEDKSRVVGEICEASKHNPDRDDSRDFPSYSSEEYEYLPELGGTSAWRISTDNDQWKSSFCSSWNLDSEVAIEDNHCYIVAGDYEWNHDDKDYNEVVIEEAVVYAVVY